MAISPKAYNEKIGLALFCPITSLVKGYPFEVHVQGGKIAGSVLCDQVKSLDWTVRNTEFIETLDDARLIEVLEKIKTLID